MPSITLSENIFYELYNIKLSLIRKFKGRVTWDTVMSELIKSFRKNAKSSRS